MQPNGWQQKWGVQRQEKNVQTGRNEQQWWPWRFTCTPLEIFASILLIMRWHHVLRIRWSFFFPTKWGIFCCLNTLTSTSLYQLHIHHFKPTWFHNIDTNIRIPKITYTLDQNLCQSKRISTWLWGRPLVSMMSSPSRDSKYHIIAVKTLALQTPSFSSGYRATKRHLISRLAMNASVAFDNFPVNLLQHFPILQTFDQH